MYNLHFPINDKMQIYFTVLMVVCIEKNHSQF